MMYGCIGEVLKHSFSREIHMSLNDYPYELCELSRDELDGFMRSAGFKAINVTIPYKETVLKHLNFVSSSVKSIGVCNCIVNKEGMLYGYNTDYDGVKYLLDKKFKMYISL